MTNTIFKVIWYILLFILIWVLLSDYVDLAVCNITTLAYDFVNSVKRILYWLMPITTRVAFWFISILIVRFIYNLIKNNLIKSKWTDTNISVWL